MGDAPSCALFMRMGSAQLTNFTLLAKTMMISSFLHLTIRDAFIFQLSWIIMLKSGFLTAVVEYRKKLLIPDDISAYRDILNFKLLMQFCCHEIHCNILPFVYAKDICWSSVCSPLCTPSLTVNWTKFCCENTNSMLTFIWMGIWTVLDFQIQWITESVCDKRFNMQFFLLENAVYCFFCFLFIVVAWEKWQSTVCPPLVLYID